MASRTVCQLMEATSAAARSPLSLSSQVRCLSTTSSLKFNRKMPKYVFPFKGRKRNFAAENKVRGINLLRDPRLNKGLSYTLKERQMMGIHGLLPPAVFHQDDQVKRVLFNLRNIEDDLQKYIFLTSLSDRNEKLFYRVIMDNIEEMAPIIYTPTVGQACQKYGLIFRKPKGLYITINDKENIHDILCNWPETDVKAIVVTDGERILGLGDLGAFGMGIPNGKLALYTAMGGIPPHQCLPIVLDVGTDNDKLLSDPMYIGLRHKRVRGPTYDDFISHFLEAVVERFGQSTLIQFEDFANVNAFRLLELNRNKYLTFNDDIQGTASVALAGMIAAMRITKTALSDHKYLFQGAGEASIGIAKLLIMAMEEEGLTEEAALERIWMVDSRGLLTKDRPSGGISVHKEMFCKDFKHMRHLEEICREIQPTAAIGAAAVAGAFTEQFIRDMGEFNDRPIIFALSNPTSLAECTAEQAYTLTNGRCVFASGSPFDPVTIDGITHVPGQGNNAYIFPGVALAAIAARMFHISDTVFLRASQALADMVTEEHLSQGRVYPPLQNIRGVSTGIATRILEYAYAEGVAGTYPEPDDKEAYIRAHQYSPYYESYIPRTYPWPGSVSEDMESYGVQTD